jgi:putative two-component system response regulator
MMSSLVWIVDDNADSRALARAILAPAYDLREVESGTRAVEMLDSGSTPLPGLLLLDISMPGMNGFEVLAAVRSRPIVARIPVVAYTARASGPERKTFLSHGFDACVVKPVLEEIELLGPVAKLLSAAPVVPMAGRSQSR